MKGRRLFPLFAVALAGIAGSGPVSAALTICTPGPFIVFFAPNATAIDEQSRAILDNFHQNHLPCADAKVSIDGHTDTREQPALGLQRARAIRRYLIGHATPRKLIHVHGHGASDLRKLTGPGVGELQNRRVELMLHPPDQKQW